MGPRVPFVSNPFGAIGPNKVVETETKDPRLRLKIQSKASLSEATKIEFLIVR